MEYLTPEDVAKILKLHVNTVYQYLLSGKLKGAKLGGDGPWRIKPEDLKKFTKGKRVTIHGGYILQPRSLDQSTVMKEPPIVRELWLYLLRKVNYKDNGRFQRGTNFFSFNDIQDDLCWYVGYRKMVYSKPRLTKALRRLCEGNMTATTKATRGVIITVLNYSYYQDPANYEGNDEDHTKVTRRSKGGRTINKKEEEEKKKKVNNNIFVETSEPFRLSKHLLERIWENNPKYKEPNLQEWAKHVDRMIRIDKRDVSDIHAVIDWCQGDYFWKGNILSTDKLRKQFDTLQTKMITSDNGKRPVAQAEYSPSIKIPEWPI